MAGVGPVGLGPPLAAAPGARLGRLGQVRDRTRRRQLLADEQPAGAGLERDLDLLPGKVLGPGAHGRTIRVDPAAAELARLGVHSVEGDLGSVHVESGYDRHQGPPLSSGLIYRAKDLALSLGRPCFMPSSGTRTLACAAIKVASASCSTCSSRPVGALRGGSLYERRRHCRASLWVSCASRPSTRTFKACPSASWPRYSAAPTCCCAEGLRSPTSIPSEAIASRTCAVGGTPAAVPNASRAIAPAARPRARPANAPDGSEAPSTTAPSDASGTSHVASTRTERTSSGPTTTTTAVATASLSSG